MEKVILVDEKDNVLGEMEKMEAHRRGLLHRAFSILLFNARGEMLLQKRSPYKYHSGGLWTNACCSHPSPSETMKEATHRKLKQEMGIEAETEFVYSFIYKTNLDQNLIEHELDHVFAGWCDATPVINPIEVEDWKYISPAELKDDIRLHPDQYTSWFKLILAQKEIICWPGFQGFNPG